MAWPKTDDPKTEFVTVRMTVGESADLDAYAIARWMSRSAAARDAIDRVIAAGKLRAKKTAKAGEKPCGRIDEGAHDE